MLFKRIRTQKENRDSIGPLLDEVNHFTNRDTDKSEMFNALFASVFNMALGSGVLYQRTMTRGVIDSQLTLNLFKIHYSS